MPSDDSPRFNPSSAVPLYEQAADYVAAQIADGRLAAGQKLPAMDDLASEWGIALDTVKRAMAELRQRGLVIARVGKGTFIAGG